MDLFGYSKTDEELNREIVKSIEGLDIIDDFISRQEESELIEAIDKEAWMSDLNRKVQHYGFRYDYRSRRIDESQRIGDLPPWIEPIKERFIQNEITNLNLDQLIVNNYEVGQGIAMHVDCEPCFDNQILSLSLGSDIVMDLKNVSNGQISSILLKRRSLLLLSGDARYNYEHGIAKRKNDNFNNEKRSRKRRISLTFRKVNL